MLQLHVRCDKCHKTILVAQNGDSIANTKPDVLGASLRTETPSVLQFLLFGTKPPKSYDFCGYCWAQESTKYDERPSLFMQNAHTALVVFACATVLVLSAAIGATLVSN